METEGWRRMVLYGGPLIRAHPLLEPVREKSGAVITHAHERAIFLTADRTVDSGGWNISEAIERPEWWLPLTKAHGQEIADELAQRVRAAWDRRR